MNLYTLYNYVFGDTAQAAPIPATVKLTAAQEERKKAGHDRKKAEFTFITSNPELSAAFRNMLRVQNSRDLECLLYGNYTDVLEQTVQHMSYGMPTDEDIKAKFGILEQKCGYFTADRNAGDIFVKLVKACKLIADYVEENNSDDNGVAYLHAYKMMALFKTELKNPFDMVDKFIGNHGRHYAKPIHDTFVLPIPPNSPPLKHLGAWQKLIQQHGVSVLSLFQKAPEIERFLEGQEPFIFTLESIQKAATQISYQQFAINPELAALCLQYRVTEEHFNSCLKIKPKSADRLPDVMVDGNTIEQPGYYLVKLPVDDPRAYILGHMTNCCQSIGGDSEKCVIDGITLENNGFYVLLKAKSMIDGSSPIHQGKINYADYNIVGQGYAWLSQLDNLTFDSWENKTPERDDAVIQIMLRKFASACFEAKPSIARVTIGTGGKTPDAYYTTIVAHPEVMAEGRQYGDSRQQALVAINPAVADVINEKLRTMGVSQPCDLWSTQLLLFLNEEIVATYQQTLGSEKYNALLGYILKSPNLWGIVFALHQTHSLNDENFNLLALIASHDNQKTLVSSLCRLYTENPDCSIPHTIIKLLYEDVFRYRDNEPWVNNLIELHKIKPDLITDKNIELLNRLDQFSLPVLCDMLHSLHEVKLDFIIDIIFELLIRVWFERVRQGNIGGAPELVDALILLHRANPDFITIDKIELLLLPLNNVGSACLWKGMDATRLMLHTLLILHQINPDLMTDEIFTLLIQNPMDSYHLNDALKSLAEINPGLVTQKNLKQLLMNTKPGSCYKLRNLLCCNAPVLLIAPLTGESCSFLIQDVNVHNVYILGKILKTLAKVNPALLTEENVNLLISKLDDISNIGFAIDRADLTFLTTEKLKQIILRPNNIGLGDIIITILATNKTLVTNENVELLLQSNPENFDCLKDTLDILHKINASLLTNAMFRLLIQNLKHAGKISEALVSILPGDYASMTNQVIIALIEKITSEPKQVAPRENGFFEHIGDEQRPAANSLSPLAPIM